MRVTSYNSDKLVISHLTLRRTLGILGIALPIILAIGMSIAGNCAVQSTISDYYHTPMRDVFVGVLCAFGLFLYAYKGYGKLDNILGHIACICALGIAFFPTSICNPVSGCVPQIDNGLTSTLHFIFAALFLCILAYYSLFLFTKSDHPLESMTYEKKIRNRIFITCGILMIVFLLLIAIYLLFLEDKFPQLRKLSPVFWLESAALWAFGFSWIVKGEMLLKDGSMKQN